MRRAVLALVALALVTLPAAAVAARCQQTTVVDLEDEVMCPVCGMTIGLAREAPQAKRERAFIEGLVASCRSKDEIKAALVAEFGPAVLAEPAARGFSASAYLVPLIAGAGVCAAVMLALRRWRRRPGTDGAVRAVVGDAETRRLEAELERLR